MQGMRMWPVVTCATWSLCVCLLVITASPIQTTELIEIQFGIWPKEPSVG